MINPESLEAQKNLNNCLFKYVQTENPTYAAWGLWETMLFLEGLYNESKFLYYFLKWLDFFSHMRRFAFIYEETVGIHIILLADKSNAESFTPDEYIRLIPLKKIKKVKVPPHNEPFRPVVIKTCGKKYKFNIRQNLLYDIDDPLHNNRETELMGKLRALVR